MTQIEGYEIIYTICKGIARNCFWALVIIFIAIAIHFIIWCKKNPK